MSGPPPLRCGRRWRASRSQEGRSYSRNAPLGEPQYTLPFAPSTIDSMVEPIVARFVHGSQPAVLVVPNLVFAVASHAFSAVSSVNFPVAASLTDPSQRSRHPRRVSALTTSSRARRGYCTVMVPVMPKEKCTEQ